MRLQVAVGFERLATQVASVPFSSSMQEGVSLQALLVREKSIKEFIRGLDSYGTFVYDTLRGLCNEVKNSRSISMPILEHKKQPLHR